MARTHTAPRYLVEGLLPAGAFCILAAPGKQGKSTLAHHLELAIAGGAPDFLGYAIPSSEHRRNAAILTGEELETDMAARVGRMRAGGLCGMVVCSKNTGDRNLAAALASIENFPRLALVVVDSENHWMRGDNKQAHDTRARPVPSRMAQRRPGLPATVSSPPGR